jgi:hypothetical protein
VVLLKFSYEGEIFWDGKNGNSQFSELVHVVVLIQSFFKTNIRCMNPSYCNDQAYIAGSFCLEEDYLERMAKLAAFKIHSYKLSMVNAAFCTSRKELGGIIRTSLLNYTHPFEVLENLGFFNCELDN